MKLGLDVNQASDRRQCPLNTLASNQLKMNEIRNLPSMPPLDVFESLFKLKKT